MNTSSLGVVLSILLTTSICFADVMALNQAPNPQIPSGILSKHNTVTAQKSEPIELQKITVELPQKHKILLPMESIIKELAVNDPIAMVLAEDYQYRYTKPQGLISSVTPEYAVKRGFLSLTKIPNSSRRKESIMFVVLMDKEKVDPNQSVVLNNHSRPRVHVMGPRRMFQQQKLIENEYPVDVSSSQYEDGYSSEDLNVVLPNKKPREVAVSFLWSF